MPLDQATRTTPLSPSQLLACHDCDALFECRPLEEGETVICPRCQAKLHSCRKNSVHRSTALAISASVLFIVANLYPFLTLEVSGQLSEISLSQSVSELEARGSPWLAAGVAIFIIGSPSLMLLGMLYLLLPLLSGRRLPGALAICRWVYGTDPWNMIEVFLIGVLVSLLKLGDIAKVSLGTSFWAFAGVIVCLTASLGSIDRRELWDRLEVAGK